MATPNRPNPPAPGQPGGDAQNGQPPQDGTNSRQRRITCFQVFYTRERVTNITFTYGDGRTQSHNEDTQTYTKVEELQLADDEEIIYVWLDRTDRGRNINRLVAGTSYGRLTKLCGNMAPSKDELKMFRPDGKALAGFSNSDEDEVFQWDPRTTDFRVDGVMSTLEVSISLYEKATKESGSSDDSDTEIGIYKELVDSISVAVRRFVGDIRTLRMLASAGAAKDDFSDPGHISDDIQFYTNRCSYQQKDIWNRFQALFSVIKGARAGRERVQIFEELVVMSSFQIASKNLEQWKEWVLGCKDELIHGLQERLTIVQSHYETMQALSVKSKEKHCLCTRSLVLYDREATSRAEVAYTYTKERLEYAQEERVALEATFKRLLDRAMSLERYFMEETTITKRHTYNTSDIPALWPPDSVSGIAGTTSDNFLERMKMVWVTAATVREIRQYLMAEEAKGIFSDLRISVEWAKIIVEYPAQAIGTITTAARIVTQTSDRTVREETTTRAV